jgi:lysyl-tRNA synthetase class II
MKAVLPLTRMFWQYEGRIRTIRESSSKLKFHDIVQDGVKIQVVSSLARVGGDVEAFKASYGSFLRGDIVCTWANAQLIQVLNDED